MIDHPEEEIIQKQEINKILLIDFDEIIEKNKDNLFLTNRNQTIGTPQYVSPLSLIRGIKDIPANPDFVIKGTKKFNYRDDLWALGNTLLEIVGLIHYNEWLNEQYTSGSWFLNFIIGNMELRMKNFEEYWSHITKQSGFDQLVPEKYVSSLKDILVFIFSYQEVNEMKFLIPLVEKMINPQSAGSKKKTKNRKRNKKTKSKKMSRKRKLK